MSMIDFLKHVVQWRVSGGHADELKRLGVQSGQAAASGNNTVLSNSVLPSRTTGTGNTAIGTGALANITSGANNFAMGIGAGTDSVQNVTTQSNVGVLGNSSTTNIYAKVALTVTSDERDKTQFQALPWTLEMVKNIKVGAFQFRDRSTGELQGPTRYGFSAQNLLMVEQMEGGSNVLVDCNDPENLKVRESMLLPVLVKAVQDLTAQVEDLQQQVRILNAKGMSYGG